MFQDSARNFVRSTLNAHRTGYSFPSAVYHDDSVYQAEMEAIFYSEWLFATVEAELPEQGDYVTLQVGSAPVVIVRDKEGAVRAFHNSCRHRGSRLCDKARGSAERLVCPYHQWTYDLNGALISARFMGDDFDASDFPLKPVHVTSIEGLIYICLADMPPDIDRFRRSVTPYIAPHDLRRTKIVHESTIVEDANWKLVIENNRECYHCASNHPELLVSLVEMALPDDQRFGDEFDIMQEKARAWDALGLPHRPVGGGVEFRCIRLPFRKGAVSMTMDGAPACKKLLGDLIERDLGSVRMFRAPNNWHHVLADMSIHFRIIPLGPNRTEVRTVWCVHEDAVEGWDYDVDHLSHVWLETNDQDRKLAEENHRGTASRGYEPGPYSKVSEFMILDFQTWYHRSMDAWLGPRVVPTHAAE